MSLKICDNAKFLCKTLLSFILISPPTILPNTISLPLLVSSFPSLIFLFLVPFLFLYSPSFPFSSFPPFLPFPLFPLTGWLEHFSYLPGSDATMLLRFFSPVSFTVVGVPGRDIPGIRRLLTLSRVFFNISEDLFPSLFTDGHMRSLFPW